jgi:hypothetical protein
MTEQQSGFAPTDPSVRGDSLAREPEAAEHGAPHAATDLEAEPKEAETGYEAERSGRPGRHLALIGWSLVVVLAVVGALMVVELTRISAALNNNGCILRAQAQFMQAQGPGVTPKYAGLDRLTGLNQLSKCRP